MRHCLGVDRIHKSMTAYVKALSKRSEGDDKEKTLPIAHLGSSMVTHGEDFDGNSEYGQCLTSKCPQIRQLWHHAIITNTILLSVWTD